MASDAAITQNLRRLINIVDGLRDVGLHHYINLPRICVVGTQSAGKSSVLEAIVGIDFLPRGEGVVTRRPLELRLVHTVSEDEKPGEQYAVFEARKDQRYIDFDDVRHTIEQLTDERAGSNKGIIAEPIVLTVYSPHCPDLTLIDLPGITRVPLKGSDQTDDIERLTRDMAARYARDPQTIILAVVPANADISTSDALQLARKLDPLGVRTIGVITKIDLMDKGTNAVKMLMGDEVPLRLGYTGVRNRSQADIRAKKSIQDALQDEKEFFSNSPAYKALPAQMLGTQALIDKLTRVLFRHIRACLPEIKKEINVRVRHVEVRLEELGNGVPVESQERVQLMWGMITDYCEVFRNTIRGKFDKKIQAYFESDITSGAHIRSIFNELLNEFVDSSVTSSMSDYDIDVAIRMHEGDSLPGFPSPDTFEYLILPHLRTIQPHVIDCLERVTQTLEALSQTIANKVFGRFPRLAEQVLELSSTILSREKHNTKSILENVVAAEVGYLFTNDARYLTEHGSMIPTQEKVVGEKPRVEGAVGPEGMSGDAQVVAGQTPVGPGGATQPGPTQNPGMPISHVTSNAVAAYNSLQHTMANMWTSGSQDGRKKTHYSAPFIKEIRSRLDAYFSIVLRNIRDSAPKIIGYFLVRQLQDKLQFELYNALNKAETLADLLLEPPHIREERIALHNQITTFRKAIQVLQRDPSIAAMAVHEFDEHYDRDLAQSQTASPPGRPGGGAAGQQPGCRSADGSQFGRPLGTGGVPVNQRQQQSAPQGAPPNNSFRPPYDYPAVGVKQTAGAPTPGAAGYGYGSQPPSGSAPGAGLPASQTASAPAPSMGNLWGLRSSVKPGGSAAVASTVSAPPLVPSGVSRSGMMHSSGAQPLNPAGPGVGSNHALFGDRPSSSARSDAVSHLFSDPKHSSNPLYS